MADKSKLSDLDLSQDEIKRLSDAFKDEKFRELFREYAEEISDPENRRRYEEEIAQLESERGMDVTFIKPEPGYVLKTSVDGDTKAFINISKCDKIDKPSAKRGHGQDGKNGLMWQIPHSFAPPREDLDKMKKRCKVFDFVIHPDTYRMAESNVRFKKMVEDTALDGIERQFGVQLDKKNIKRPKIEFKGVPQSTVKRTRNTTGPQNVPDASGLLQNMPYPYDDKTSAEKVKEKDETYEQEQKKKKEIAAKQKSKLEPNNDVDATVPKYSITHRSEVDMQEYRNARDSKPSTRPKELVIKIELPLLSSAAQANLDIFERKLLLESKTPAAYKLDMPLPFPVNELEGSAKFDKLKKVLIVTLPVLLSTTPTLSGFDDPDVPLEQEDGSSPQKPLIEVIANGDHSTEDIKNKVNGEVEQPYTTMNGSKKFTPQISLTLPEFSFTQDAETVSFVLKVRNVSVVSVKKTFPSPSDVQLQYTSKGSGGFPIHYSLYLQFGEGCKMAADHCSADVTAENMVLLLLKDHSSRGLWDRFYAGLDANQLKEHLFLTPSNLQQQLEELDAAAAEREQPNSVAREASSGTTADPAPHSLLVTNMDEKKLTIQITPAKKVAFDAPSKDEDDEYDPPSSAEIQVVHTQPPPNLQSILKQRTMSESSEDVNIDPESPRSPIEDEDELSSSFKRRSVSFSDHIDQATFKIGASVTSMKTVLKSKRRRQRKWEERQKNGGSNRKRNNSTGSEGSGDDHGHSLSDSHDDDTETQKDGGVVVGAHGSDIPVKLDFRTKQSGNKKRGRGKGKKTSSGKKEGSIQCGSSQDDSDQSSERTSGEVFDSENSPEAGDSENSPENTGDFDWVMVKTKGKSSKKEGDNPRNAGKPTEAGEPGSTALASTKDFVDISDKSMECDPSKQPEQADVASKQSTDQPKQASELSDEASDLSKLINNHSSSMATIAEVTSTGQDKSPDTSRDKRLAAEVKAKLAAGPKEGEDDDSDDEDDWQDAVEDNSDDKPQEGDNPAVKTALSWDEGKRDTGENNEHRTACAFSFNNAVMFDLDNE